jgi:uncharacterized Zn finger protein
MWREYGWFPPSRPREAKGGIKAQSQRGRFGETWWGRRWVEVLEGFYLDNRLARGRSYARQGQVLSIDVGPGRVDARVQGSRPQPYAVVLRLPELSAKDWKALAQELRRQAIFAAKLLAGEMPQEIEGVARAAGLSLFPRQLKDLQTSCSCPDFANPCKHVAAVYYLLAEEFDRDPFLLFKLRGRDRGELLAALGEAAPVAAAEQPAAAQPLSADAQAFWGGADLPDDFFGDVEAPPVAAALPRRLGNFPFWRGGERFLDALAPIYSAATPQGLEAFVGERTGETA